MGDDTQRTLHGHNAAAWEFTSDTTARPGTVQDSNAKFVSSAYLAQHLFNVLAWKDVNRSDIYKLWTTQNTGDLALFPNSVSQFH